MSKITACIITRDAPSVFEAIASVRPHVDAIVVVDTGSADADFIERLRQLAEDSDGGCVRVERFTDCNDRDGKIADFALARQRCFDLVETLWAVWLDSDDRVEGAEKLRGIAAQIDGKLQPDIAAQVLFPYEYSYHPNGTVSCLQWRERLIRLPRGGFRWQCPVHEVCLPVDPARTFVAQMPDVVWKHRRGTVDAPSDPGRNLRIMRRWVATEEGAKDVRARFYLAQELTDAGEVDEALQHYDWHFRRSGWDDERMMGMMRSSSIHLARNDIDAAEQCAQRLVELRDDWGEGWFALGRCAYVRADKKIASGDPTWQQDAARAIRHFRRGLALPATSTPLFIDLRERAVAVHEMINKSLSDLGDLDAALQSCEEGLRSEPSNPNLLHNRGHYRRLLAVRDSHTAIDAAASVGAIGPDVAAAAKEAVAAAIGGNVGRIGVGAWPAAVQHPAGYPAQVSEEARPVATLTPHAHAWGIPDSFEAVGLPLKMTDAQLRSMVLALWHELVLHDELMTAEYLLEHAPYRVHSDPDVLMALVITRKMTSWMDDAAEVQRVNAPADPNVETGDPLPGPIGMAAGQRLALVLDRLKPRERVLDLGCFDGAFTNRMGLAGVFVTGVDQAQRSVAVALIKAKEFNTGAQYVCEGFDRLERSPMTQRFETVTTTDTWEHLRDPGQLVRVAEKHLLPGGRMLVVTPLGSWMRGRVIPWAHPWRWGQEVGKPWICDEARAHLHAPSTASVASEFDPELWRVVDCYPVLNRWPDTEGQGWVFCEAEFRGAPTKSKGNVAIVLGRCWERWTPRTAEQGGIGGSETAVVEMARRLQQIGWEVTVFGDMEPEGEGWYGGVRYVRHEKIAVAQKSYDVLVAWRDAALLNALPAKTKLLWVHDVWAGNGTHAKLLKADAVLGLSAWHCDFIRNHHALPAGQVTQTRNGIDVARFEQAVERDPAKAVYSSSPDRGLWALLQMWPRIKERVPAATLHVFYGFDNWIKSAQASGDQGQLANIVAMQAKLGELAPMGVVVRGRANQAELAREFLSAGAWLYSTWFCCHPDTRISVPGDHRGGAPTVRIADMVGKAPFPVYAFNEAENRFQIATCLRVWETKIANELIELELDSGQTLRVTPDHLILTFDGDWVEAGTLLPGASLRALHYRYNVAIKDGNGRWASEHRLVGEWKEGRRLRRDEHVDHADPERLDNRPEMLEVMTASAHFSKTHKGKRLSRKHIEKKRLSTIAGMAAMSPERRKAWHEAGGRANAERLRAMDQTERDAMWAARNAKKRATIESRRALPLPYEAREGHNHKVVAVRRLAGPIPVYDMEVEGIHNFVADGIVVHNCETSCITAAEAQCAGLYCVHTPIAALAETVLPGDHSYPVAGDWLSAEYQDLFVEAAVEALTDGGNLDRAALMARAREQFDWQRVAEDWSQMLDRMLVEPRSDRLPAYVPHPAFQRPQE